MQQNQPNYNNYNSGHNAPPPGNGLGIASMVCGIVALVLTWIPVFGSIISLILAVLGVVLGVMAKNKNAAVGAPAGMATAGLVCGIVALALSVLTFFICGACTACSVCNSAASLGGLMF